MMDPNYDPPSTSLSPTMAPAEALTVRPGDTLIIRVSSDITRQQFEELTDRIKWRLPGVDVLVLTADQIAAYKPEEQP